MRGRNLEEKRGESLLSCNNVLPKHIVQQNNSKTENCNPFKGKTKLSVVAHACNPCIQEAEAGGS